MLIFGNLLYFPYPSMYFFHICNVASVGGLLYVHFVYPIKGILFLGENCIFSPKKCWFLKTSYISLLLQWITSIFRILLTYMWTPLCIHHWHQRGSMFWGRNCSFLLKSVSSTNMHNKWYIRKSKKCPGTYRMT